VKIATIVEQDAPGPGEHEPRDEQAEHHQRQLGPNQWREPEHDAAAHARPARDRLRAGGGHQRPTKNPRATATRVPSRAPTWRVPDDGYGGDQEQTHRHDDTVRHSVGPALLDPRRGAADRERADGSCESGDRGDPLHARERSEQRSADDEHEQPQRGWSRLRSAGRIEHRTVPGKDLIDDPEVDERVFVHPPVRPTADEDHDRGEPCRHGPAGALPR